MKPLLPHCFLLLSPLGRQGLVFISSAFYFSLLRFSLERLGIGSQSRIPTLIPAGCLGLSAGGWSQLYSTKAFPLPGLKIAFAPVPRLASILQLLTVCYFFSPPDTVSGSQSQSLDPIWSTQTTLFCIGFLGHRAGSKMSVRSPYCWREKRTLQGLLELFMLVFHGGEKSLSFLGLFFAWSLSLLNRRDFNDRGSGSPGSDEVQKWSVLAGGARIPWR